MIKVICRTKNEKKTERMSKTKKKKIMNKTQSGRLRRLTNSRAFDSNMLRIGGERKRLKADYSGLLEALIGVL